MTNRADEGSEALTRRGALAAAGAVGIAALPGCAHEASPAPRGESSPDGADGAATRAGGRLPVAFVPHGGGPWPFVEGLGDPAELAELAAYLRSVRDLPKQPVQALLVVSAHWEEAVPTVMTAEQPPMLYDYHGFPPASYAIQWPAAGRPVLAARVQELLRGAGFDVASDATRGFDHGTFVPLKLTYPDADVPTIQLSLKAGLDPAEHLAMGRALAPLRDEGIFIVGSGMTYHNMRGFRDPRAGAHAESFDAWLRETATLEASERDRRLTQWASAPSARQAHPREEHLIPLMVIAGAAGADRASIPFQGTVMSKRVSAYHFG